MSSSVIILGAGAIGLCCAHYARDAGFDVTVIDRNGPARDGCSFGNAGMVVPSHFVPLAAPGMVEMGLRMMRDRRSPFSVRPRLSRDLLSWGTKFVQSATAEHVRRAGPVLRDLNLASRAEYVALAERFGDAFGLKRHGLLMLCRTPEVLAEEAHLASDARRMGLRAEDVDSIGIAKLEPSLSTDVAGGVYFPDDCHLDPSAFMTTLQSSLVARGVRFLWNTEVRDVQSHAGRIDGVVTTQGVVHADQYVLAGGAWSPVLAAQLGIDLPMQAGKGYSLTLEHPAELPRLCAILVEARVAVTPIDGSLRFAGTMEIAGLDESVDTERVAGIVDNVPKYLPAFSSADFAGVKPWRGLRPCSPDGLPFLGRTSRVENLVMATGHAMMGLSLAPVTGKLVAEALERKKSSIPLGLLRPERFED